MEEATIGDIFWGIPTIRARKGPRLDISIGGSRISSGERLAGTSYIVPVKRENEKISSFVKTVSYKTVLILGTLFPLNPVTD